MEITRYSAAMGRHMFTNSGFWADAIFLETERSCGLKASKEQWGSYATNNFDEHLVAIASQSFWFLEWAEDVMICSHGHPPDLNQ